jgi:tetratricopeptide (TPR) repeat protein
MAEQPEADPILKLTATSLRAELEADLGRFDHARDLVKQSRVMAADLGRDIGELLTSSGWVEMMAGEPRRAEAEFEEAAAMFRSRGDNGHLAGVAPALADALFEQGRYEEALQLTETSERVAAADDCDSQIQWRRVRSKILARRGQIAEAVHLSLAAVELARSTDFLDHTGRALMDLAVVFQLADRLDEAASAARESAETFAQKGNLTMEERARHLAEELGTAI